jgi:hypothetical protein
MSDTPEKYSFSITAQKAAPPFIIVIMVQGAKAILHACGITVIDENQLYTAALMGYAGLASLVNWLKNRNKGKIAV